MASELLDTDRVETLVQSGLPDDALEIFIDGADEEIVRLVGPHDGSQQVTLRVDRSPNLYLPRPAQSVSEVKEWSDSGSEADADVVDADNYQILGAGRYLRRKSVGGLVDAPGEYGSLYWKRNVAVTFTPKGDNARRTQVLVDLVKWELARSGHTRERVGQYETYQGNERERGQILGRLRQGYGGAGLLA